MQKEMEELRQQAYMAEVAYERKQEAKRRKKSEDDAKRRREETRIRTALLEAAFDDELEELQALLKEAAQYSDEAVRHSHCVHLLVPLGPVICSYHYTSSDGVSHRMYTAVGAKRPYHGTHNHIRTPTLLHLMTLHSVPGVAPLCSSRFH